MQEIKLRFLTQKQLWDLNIKRLKFYVHRSCEDQELCKIDLFFENGNLLVHFAHGRYGYWRYNFRYKSSKFMLVGYDSDEAYGPILLRSVSINLLTKKLLLKENTNPHYRPEKIISKWSNFALKKPITLEDLTDFDAYQVCRSIQLKC